MASPYRGRPMRSVDTGAFAWLAAGIFACSSRPSPVPPRRAVVELRSPHGSLRAPAPSPMDTQLHVRWVLSSPSGETRVARSVDLVLSAGGHERRVHVEVADFGLFYALEMQCGPRRPGRLAELSLNGGGNRVYGLDRRSDGRMVFTESVSSDGACGDAGDQPCPERVSEIAVVALAGAGPVVEEYVSVDADGGRSVERCPTPP